MDGAAALQSINGRPPPSNPNQLDVANDESGKDPENSHFDGVTQMRPTKYLLAAGVAASVHLISAVGAARPATVLGAPKKAAAAATAEPPLVEVSKKFKLSPDGLHFGMMIEEIARLYDKVLDKEFSELYKDVEPGPRMNELDAELAERKRLIMKNKLELAATPSGLDGTPIGPEYTYNNGESLTQMKLRSGIHRYFFFFANHLWKVYDVHKLGPKSKLGEDFDGAVEHFTKQFGKAPRVRKADPSAGRPFDTADWADKETIVRIINHGNGGIGLAYIDRKVEHDLAKYRPNKPAREHLDSEVSSVTRSAPSDAAPPAAAAPAGKKHR